MPTDAAGARAFVMGCSRSGTTVIQYHLARHPLVYTLPETDFFGRLLGSQFWRLVGYYGRVRGRCSRRAFQKLAQAAEDERVTGPEGVFPRTAECVNAFIACLDRQAAERGRPVWLEKTPKHYRYADAIARYVPAARLVHVIRDGRDTVASIRDRAARFPDEFGHQHDPAYGVRLWNRAVRQALRRASSGRDLVIHYETFATQPGAVLERLCTFLGLGFDERMLDQVLESDVYASSEEPWKDGVATSVRAASSKFGSVFTSGERAWIERRLDWRAYRALCRMTGYPEQ